MVLAMCEQNKTESNIGSERDPQERERTSSRKYTLAEAGCFILHLGEIPDLTGWTIHNPCQDPWRGGGEPGRSRSKEAGAEEEYERHSYVHMARRGPVFLHRPIQSSVSFSLRTPGMKKEQRLGGASRRKKLRVCL